MKVRTNSHQMRCNIPDIHHKYLWSKTVVVNFTTASVCDLKEKKTEANAKGIVGKGKVK